MKSIRIDTATNSRPVRPAAAPPATVANVLHFSKQGSLEEQHAPRWWPGHKLRHNTRVIGSAHLVEAVSLVSPQGNVRATVTGDENFSSNAGTTIVKEGS